MYRTLTVAIEATSFANRDLRKSAARRLSRSERDVWPIGRTNVRGSTADGVVTGAIDWPQYPLLMRLADQGLLTTAWEQDPPQGRPARHLYRLTPHGVAVADQLRPAATSARFVAHRGTRATT
jgi:hypothetical protein